MRLSHHQLILIACSVSVTSLIVAIAAISYAVKSGNIIRDPLAAIAPPNSTLSVPEPIELTPDNPAYQLMHTKTPLSTVGGLVISISETSVVIGPESTAQTIRITSDTEVYARGKEKTQEEYDKEFAEFDKLAKQAAGTTEVFVAPDRYRNTPITTADIAPGDLLLAKIDETNQSTAVAIYKLPPVQ